MQVSIEATSALERRLTIGVPAERIENEVNARLAKAAKNVRLDGFRPGKVPLRVLQQRFGAGVRQEVMGEVMSQSFYEAVQQENLKPAGYPSIDPVETGAGKDLQYVATFEVFPEIELNAQVSASVTKPVAEVTDADVQKMVEVFRKQQASWEAVERAAQDGDQVVINYKGTKDGEAFDGGSADGSKLVLGSGRMIPGFEEGIVGLKAGEEKVLELTFPKEYHAEALKGAAVQFAVTVVEVQEQKLAELNDEFFAMYGVSEGGEEKFLAEIRQNMTRELANAVKNKVKQQVMDALLAGHADLEVPKALISQEIKQLRDQQLRQFGQLPQGFDASSLLPDELFSEQAERRVKLGLLLNEYIAKQEIKADKDAVRAAVEEMAATYQDPQEVIDWYYKNPEQLQGVESMVLEDAAVAKLLEGVEVVEKSMSYEEALSRAADEEDDEA